MGEVFVFLDLIHVVVSSRVFVALGTRSRRSESKEKVSRAVQRSRRVLLLLLLLLLIQIDLLLLHGELIRVEHGLQLFWGNKVSKMTIMGEAYH